jgi:hypothetical protein
MTDSSRIVWIDAMLPKDERPHALRITHHVSRITTQAFDGSPE